MTLSSVITILLLAILVGMAAWLLIRVGQLSHQRDQLIQVNTRLDAYLQQLENLEKRLGELKGHTGDASAELRERLTERLEGLRLGISENMADGRTQLVRSFGELRENLQSAQAEHRTQFELRQGDAIKALMDSLTNGMNGIQKQLGEALAKHAEAVSERVDKLTKTTDGRLQEISGQVEKRLSEGFEKTTATFADIVKRLALIDVAQKKITELSTNVVSLQEILSDKRSRGAFGEVQLNGLIRNALPEASFAIQYTLPNATVADCILFLPEPTGKVVIDSKFPLESYQRMTDYDTSEIERKACERQFKQDIRKHITDIAEKYIIPGTTSDGAVMFIPAESVFAEIQAHHPDLVEAANSVRVWMVSPTTLWAVLNTARAVLKDAATREQVHVIQEHLGYLATDFERFQSRMDALATHIRQANEDVQKVSTSARKISARFDKIERVELDNPDAALLDKNQDIS